MAPVGHRGIGALLALGLLASTTAAGTPLRFDRSRARNLESWKPAIAAYSSRHYGEAEWRLEPRCIVLHYTAGMSFPWNLVKSTDFAGEPPGLACHFVVDGTSIWEILPPTVRSRGAYGINHQAINIEMVAADARDLARRPATLDTTARLVAHLLERFGLPESEVYSHQQVATVDPAVVPGVRDLIDPSPYGKIDPGEKNMTRILAAVRRHRIR